MTLADFTLARGGPTLATLWYARGAKPWTLEREEVFVAASLSAVRRTNVHRTHNSAGRTLVFSRVAAKRPTLAC